MIFSEILKEESNCPGRKYMRNAWGNYYISFFGGVPGFSHMKTGCDLPDKRLTLEDFQADDWRFVPIFPDKRKGLTFLEVSQAAAKNPFLHFRNKRYNYVSGITFKEIIDRFSQDYTAKGIRDFVAGTFEPSDWEVVIY